jgi:hypothetical protein
VDQSIKVVEAWAGLHDFIMQDLTPMQAMQAMAGDDKAELHDDQQGNDG